MITSSQQQEAMDVRQKAPNKTNPAGGTSRGPSRRKDVHLAPRGKRLIPTARNQLDEDNRPDSQGECRVKDFTPAASIPIEPLSQGPKADRGNQQQTAVRRCRCAVLLMPGAGRTFQARGQRPNGHCRLPSLPDHSRPLRNNRLLGGWTEPQQLPVGISPGFVEFGLRSKSCAAGKRCSRQSY